MKRTTAEFAHYFACELARRKMTVAEMCRLLDITPSKLSRWATRNEPMNEKIGDIIAITKYLHLSLDAFFGLKQDYPEDVKDIVFMLMELDADTRDIVRSQVRIFYDKELEKNKPVRSCHTTGRAFLCS